MESYPQSLSLVEQLTANFYIWEQRGRGWQVWNYPVELEPPFEPFFHYIPSTPILDDGRRPTFLSSLIERFLPSPRETGTQKSVALEPFRYSDLPEPIPFEEDASIVEIEVSLPKDEDVAIQAAEQFLLSITSCEFPISYELIGTGESIITQLTCRERDSAQVVQELQAYFPEAVLIKESNALHSLLSPSKNSIIVDFGLAEEFMRPVRTLSGLDPDPLIGIIASLEGLCSGEIGALQILFQIARYPWAESIIHSVTDTEGGSFFADAPEMLHLAREKIRRPLFATVLRIVGSSPTSSRAWEIARSLAGGLTVFAQPDSNEFIPLTNDNYDDTVHKDDVILRRSHRTGMLLNSSELVSFVHLPSASVKSSKLVREVHKSKSAPNSVIGHQYVIGENIHRGERTVVSLNTVQRLRHIHIIGATGTGKSTLLLNLILQDMQHAQGIAILDPHGDLVDAVLERIPEKRIEDVILFDPSDTEYPVGFNILQARTEIEKNVLSSDLVAIFRRFATSWGDQMSAVLGNAVSAFLESEARGTLVNLRQFLIEKDYRDELLRSVSDPMIRNFWEKEFSILRGIPQASIITRLDNFLRPKIIRYIVGQQEGLDFADIVEGRKIFLAKLAQGLIGEENAYFLGSLIAAKLHQVIIGRQARDIEERTPFYLYIDEFQNFVTPSMTAILSGGRKHGLGLILAHQDLRQLWDFDTALANSVITNPGTRICFRLGDIDAQKLKDGFAAFDASDLQNLNVGETIVRIDRQDQDFNLRTFETPQVESNEARRKRETVIDLSRKKYGHTFEHPEVVLAPEKEKRDHIPIPIQYSEKPAESRDVIPPRKERIEKPAVIDDTHRQDISKHRYLQTLIKRLAEQRGYRAVIEEPTPDGTGRVDIGLERNGQKIAVEISVTTDDVQELRNIEKCLRAEYSIVIVCSSEVKNLDAIRKLMIDKLSSEDQCKVHLLGPEELFLFLDEQATKEASKEERIKGYRVKVQYKAVSDVEKKRKREAVGQVIIQSMKRINKGLQKKSD